LKAEAIDDGKEKAAAAEATRERATKQRQEMQQKDSQGAKQAMEDGITDEKESLEMKKLRESKPTDPDSEEMMKWQGEMETLKVQERAQKLKEEEEKDQEDAGIVKTLTSAAVEKLHEDAAKADAEAKAAKQKEEKEEKEAQYAADAKVAMARFDQHVQKDLEQTKVQMDAARAAAHDKRIHDRKMAEIDAQEEASAAREGAEAPAAEGSPAEGSSPAKVLTETSGPRAMLTSPSEIDAGAPSVHANSNRLAPTAEAAAAAAAKAEAKAAQTAKAKTAAAETAQAAIRRALRGMDRIDEHDAARKLQMRGDEAAIARQIAKDSDDDDDDDDAAQPSSASVVDVIDSSAYHRKWERFVDSGTAVSTPTRRKSPTSYVPGRELSTLAKRLSDAAKAREVRHGAEAQETLKRMLESVAASAP